MGGEKEGKFKKKKAVWERESKTDRMEQERGSEWVRERERERKREREP